MTMALRLDRRRAHSKYGHPNGASGDGGMCESRAAKEHTSAWGREGTTKEAKGTYRAGEASKRENRGPRTTLGTVTA